jgi:hypothetical protein
MITPDQVTSNTISYEPRDTHRSQEGNSLKYKVTLETKKSTSFISKVANGIGWVISKIAKLALSLFKWVVMLPVKIMIDLVRPVIFVAGIVAAAYFFPAAATAAAATASNIVISCLKAI